MKSQQTKRHPRDWSNPGRVRVQLKGPNNFFVNSNVTTRRQLCKAIAERMPQVQKDTQPPKNIITPLTSLKEVEDIVNEQRKAQGLPPLSEMQPKNPTIPAKPKKQKVKYVR